MASININSGDNCIININPVENTNAEFEERMKKINDRINSIGKPIKVQKYIKKKTCLISLNEIPSVEFIRGDKMFLKTKDEKGNFTIPVPMNRSDKLNSKTKKRFPRK